MEGLALICTAFPSQTLLSLGYSQKCCAWSECRARGGAWSWYTQLLLTPSALGIQGKLQSGSPATAALNTSGQRCHHALLPIKLLWAEPLKYLFAVSLPFFHLLFLSFFNKAIERTYLLPLYIFLEHKLLPSIFHHKQGGWTGKMLLFSLPFSLLYSVRNRSKWVITRADKELELTVHGLGWELLDTDHAKITKKRSKVKYRTGLFMFERCRKEIGKVSESSQEI